MSHVETLPAPTPPPPADKWQREKQAFHRLLPMLLATHKGQYVAIHEGKVIESGADKLEVAGRAYALVGYVPIFVTLVTDQTQMPIRIPTPRTMQAAHGK